MPLKLHTQDTDLKEKREVHTLKYATRKRKMKNSMSKKNTHSIIQKQKSNTRRQSASSTTKKSTAANVVDAIRILAFH